jgi:hypothetical protein
VDNVLRVGIVSALPLTLIEPQGGSGTIDAWQPTRYR